MKTIEFYENPDNIEFTSPLPQETILAGIHKKSKILDIGCGYGRILDYLYNLGYTDLVGLDISSNLIQRAKKKVANAKYIISSIEDYFPDCKFDFIIICGVLEYISSDKNIRRKFISKLYQISNYGAKIYLASFILDWINLKTYLANFFKGNAFGTLYINYHLKLFHSSPKKIDRLFSKYFHKLESNIEKFNTWSGTLTNGYISLYQKNYTEEEKFLDK